MEYEGTLEDLRTVISGCGFTINGEKENASGHQLRTKEGAIVNWWPSTKKISVQGKPEAKTSFEAAWSSYGGKSDQVPETISDIATPAAPKSAMGSH